MSTIIPTLGQKAPENAPKARKSNMAQVMAKSQFGDGEFDLSVLLAKVPPKRAIFEGSYPISYRGVPFKGVTVDFDMGSKLPPEDS